MRAIVGYGVEIGDEVLSSLEVGRFYFNNLRTRILPLLSFAKVVR